MLGCVTSTLDVHFITMSYIDSFIIDHVAPAVWWFWSFTPEKKKKEKKNIADCTIVYHHAFSIFSFCELQSVISESGFLHEYSVSPTQLACGKQPSYFGMQSSAMIVN